MPNTSKNEIIFIQIEEDTRTNTFSADLNARLTLSHLPADEDKQDFYETLSENISLTSTIHKDYKVVTHIIGLPNEQLNSNTLHNSIYFRTYNDLPETKTPYLITQLINSNLPLHEIARITSNEY